MSRFLLDTNCMVAAICAWHVHHPRALAEIERRLGRGETLVSAWPALIETYSVLTRLPKPHRLAPSDALALIRENFVDGITCHALSADGYGLLLESTLEMGIGGGASLTWSS